MVKVSKNLGATAVAPVAPVIPVLITYSKIQKVKSVRPIVDYFTVCVNFCQFVIENLSSKMSVFYE